MVRSYKVKTFPPIRKIFLHRYCKNNCITLALAQRSLNTTAVEYEENRLPKQAVLVNTNKFHTFLFQVSLCF